MKNLALIGGGLTALAAGGLGIAAATGSFGTGDSLEEIGPSTPRRIPIQKTTVEFNNGATDIKFKYKHIDCSKNLFRDIDWSNADKTNTDLSVKVNGAAQEGKAANSTWNLNTHSSQACINVWWNKSTYQTKWKGNWNLLFASKGKEYGIILVSTVTASNGKLEVDGAAYVMKHEINDNKWKIIGKEVKAKQEVNDTNKNNLLIKPSNSLPEKDKAWDSFKFENKEGICSSDCTGTPSITSESISWDFEKEETGEFNESWTSNFNEWNNNTNGLFTSNSSSIYQGLKGKFKLTS